MKAQLVRESIFSIFNRKTDNKSEDVYNQDVYNLYDEVSSLLRDYYFDEDFGQYEESYIERMIRNTTNDVLRVIHNNYDTKPSREQLIIEIERQLGYRN